MELLLELWFSYSYHNWWAICTYCDPHWNNCYRWERCRSCYSYSFYSYYWSYFSELRIYWTATNGTDYVASSVTISIPAGDLTGTVTIDPTADLILRRKRNRYCYNCICKRWKWNYYWTPDSATVTITDEQSVPMWPHWNNCYRWERCRSCYSTATLSTATTEATLVSLEYTGTATNGTDCRLEYDHINPCWWFNRTVLLTLQLTLFTKNRTVIATIASVSGGNGTTIELLILQQLP
jgi:hypothetical protein